MFKNVASQKLTVFAFDSATNLPKTGDAANLTAYRDLDDGGVTVLTDTSATEKDATNAKGYYIFDLTQGETNGDKILFSAKSSTAGVVVIAVPAVVYTVPPSFTSFVTPTGATVGSVTNKVTPIDIDGITFANWAKYVGATTQGKCVVTLISGDDYTFDYYNVAGDTIVWTTTCTLGNRAQPTRS